MPEPLLLASFACFQSRRRSHDSHPHIFHYFPLTRPPLVTPDPPLCASPSQVLKAGKGPVVAKGDSVTVHATGTVEESMKKFWSTKVGRGAKEGVVERGRRREETTLNLKP